MWPHQKYECLFQMQAKAPLQEQRENSENSHIKKRRHSSENQNRSSQTKKLKQEDVTTEMADTQKRANFSALNSPSNGFSRHASPLANNKPGSAKKLVIKNFKGLFTSCCKLESECDFMPVRRTMSGKNPCRSGNFKTYQTKCLVDYPKIF